MVGKFVQDTVVFTDTLCYFMKINTETNKDLFTASSSCKKRGRKKVFCRRNNILKTTRMYFFHDGRALRPITRLSLNFLSRHLNVSLFSSSR